MKGKYQALTVLMILSFIVTAIFLTFMPESVPMHYNFKGVADRYGSKYENLIFPLIISLIGTFFIFFAKHLQKKGEIRNEKIILLTGISVLSFLNILTAYYCLSVTTDFKTADITKITAISLGALFIVLGNLMPKATKNAIFGLRTTWSMSSDRIWQKSQRFGGITTVIFGLLIVLCGIIFNNIILLSVISALLPVWLTVTLIGSYKIYKRFKQ